jgi:hypothetical protein
MARAVNMTIVTRVGFILDVGGVDRDTPSFLFRGLVDFCVVCELGATLIRENLGNGSCQGRLAVIDMALRLVRNL